MSTPSEFPTPPTASRKLFISYAREDRGSLEEIREGIAALHHEAWIDSNLDGGQAWWDVILEEIRRCDAMVLAVSPSLLESEAAAMERNYARQLGKPLIPLVVVAVGSELLPPDIATLQFIDYTKRTPLTGAQLANALFSVRQGVPLPEPLPEPPAVPVSYLGKMSNVLRKRKLSANEQFSMATKLAASLGRPREHDAAAELLRRLEDRPDLFHQTAKEIERIWQEEAKHPGAHAPSPETARETVLGKEPEPNDAQRASVPEPTKAAFDKAPTEARQGPVAQSDQDAPRRESPPTSKLNPSAGSGNQQAPDARTAASPSSPNPEPQYFQAAPQPKPAQQQAAPQPKPAQQQAAPQPKPAQQQWAPQQNPAQQQWGPQPNPAQQQWAPQQNPAQQQWAPQPNPAQQQWAPQQVPSGPFPGMPAQRWGLSAVALILFIPLGAVALYFASQVAKHWGAGNPAGALDASKKARLWGWIGVVMGVFWYLLIIIPALASANG